MKKLIIFALVTFTASTLFVGCSTSSGIHRPDKLFKVCSREYSRFGESMTCGMIKHKDVKRLFGHNIWESNILTK